MAEVIQWHLTIRGKVGIVTQIGSGELKSVYFESIFVMVFDFSTSIPPQISKSIMGLLFPLPVTGLGHVNSGQGDIKGILLEGFGKCLLGCKVRHLP